MAEVKNQNWFRRHWIISIFLGLFLLGFINSILFNSLGENDSQSNSDLTGNIIEDNSIEETNQENNILVVTPETDWHEVITLNGKGNQNTESFYIKGEKVKITATTCCGFANEYGSVGTYSGIALKSEKGDYLGAGLSISTEGVEEGHGETIYRNLGAGEYYIGVITGVNWEVKVEEYY